MIVLANTSKEYMDLYRKEKTFFVFYNQSMYIINNKDYRKLSNEEVAFISNWGLSQVESGKFIFERISSKNVNLAFYFSDKTNLYIRKKSIKKGKKYSTLFRDEYLKRLVSFIIKYRKQSHKLSFKKIHKMALKETLSIKVFKNINRKKLSKMILNDFKTSVKYYEKFPLGRYNSLVLKKGKFKLKYNKMNAEDREKKRLKIIEGRELFNETY